MYIAIAASVFHLPRQHRSVCSVTNTLPYHYNLNTIQENITIKFNNNEALACRGGLMIVTVTPTESLSDDCAVIQNILAWRNGHTGILAVDAQAQILLYNVTLAENYIGINIHSYKTTENLFNGIVTSTVIGSLSNANIETCNELNDTQYIRGSECSVFTPNDPLGLLRNCGSVINNLYKRVGLLLPQWTNKPKTCAIAGRFAECEPATTPDRLCELPWEKRFGLPVDIGYAEQHIHNTKFINFWSNSYSSNTGNSGSSNCIPSSIYDHSVAIAINPSQVDMQPIVIVSGLDFTNTDIKSRLGFKTGSFSESECKYKPCNGHNMMLLHDLDGTLTPTQIPAQLSYKNPAYVAPYPLCYEEPSLSNGVYICPYTTTTLTTTITNTTTTISSNTELKQYTALWRDWGPQIIQPIVTTRYLETENRSFASYGPIDDLCAKRFFFSRFPLLFAVGKKHKIISTGTIPNEFLIRWDAPSVYDSTIIEFFISHSQAITVLVSNHPINGFKSIPKSSNYPTLNDPAGTNQRNPQNRYLAVTLRGGSYRYYRFRMVPVAAVTIRMEMSINQFYAETFIANMAMLLRISIDRIKIANVRSGSVIADIDISPANSVAEDSIAVTGQITELTQLTSNLTYAISSGAIETALNVTVLEVYAAPPVEQVIVDETMEIAEDDNDFNITSFRATQVLASTPVVSVLMTFPSSQPTSQPSRQPTSHPSTQPTSQPSRQPSAQPSSAPSSPTSQPSAEPTSQPSSAPTATPTGSPKPTSQPSSSQPSSQPSSSPTCVPSSIPTAIPTSKPISSAPTPTPTVAPSVIPSIPPSPSPTILPTLTPSTAPTLLPSASPVIAPSTSPSVTPTVLPTIVPTTLPTITPTCVPSTTPTCNPSLKPTSQPSQPVPQTYIDAVVEFDCVTTLSGFSAAEFNNDTNASTAFTNSVVNTTYTADTSTTVSITSVVDTTRRNRALSTGSSVIISFQVLLRLQRQYSTGSYYNTTALAHNAYSTFTTTMRIVLSTGQFTNTMKSTGLAVFLNLLTDSSSFTADPYTLTVVDTTPTTAPTVNPDNTINNQSNENSSSLNTDMIIGVSIGGFCFVSLILSYLYYYKVYKKRKNVKNVQVIECGDDRFLDLEEVYPVHSTMSPFEGTLPRGSALVHTQGGDAAVLWENNSEVSEEHNVAPLTPHQDLGRVIEEQFSQSRYASTSALSIKLTDSIRVGEIRQPEERYELDIEGRGHLTPAAYPRPSTTPLEDVIHSQERIVPFSFNETDIERDSNRNSTSLPDAATGSNTMAGLCISEQQEGKDSQEEGVDTPASQSEEVFRFPSTSTRHHASVADTTENMDLYTEHIPQQGSNTTIHTHEQGWTDRHTQSPQSPSSQV